METTVKSGAGQEVKIRKHSRAMSFVFAIKGLGQVLRQESNFRLQLALGILTLAAAALLNCSAGEWALVLVCCALVLVCEIFNSVIEELLDWMHPGQHPKVGKIKDMAAAAPFVASVFAFAAGLFIFGPKLWLIVKAFL